MGDTVVVVAERRRTLDGVTRIAEPQRAEGVDWRSNPCGGLKGVRSISQWQPSRCLP